MKRVVLATANARYFHSSLGLRCLKANLGEIGSATTILEFLTTHRAEDMAEAILAQGPSAVGLGIYIWNVELMTELVQVLRSVVPELPIVMGGPELADPSDLPTMADLADVVVVGEGELVVEEVFSRLLEQGRPKARQTVVANAPELSRVRPADHLYTDEDIRNRIIYVEASRGCPYRCVFCLSAREPGVRRWPVDVVLGQLERLWQRGVRQFKFVDRALHLGGVTANVLDWFLERQQQGLFVHFEVVPERVPDWAIERLARFGPGQVQLEAGVQTLNPVVAERIGRPQKADLVTHGLRRLRQETAVHVHADLVVGLPGEDMASIGHTFNQLWACGPHEIQVGILKRLRGAPITHMEAEWGLKFNHRSPYDVLSTSTLTFDEMQHMKRFARYFDIVANSGNFVRTSSLLLAGDDPFASFLSFSRWLHAEAGGATHGLALDRVAMFLHRYLCEVAGQGEAASAQAIRSDFEAGGRALGGPLERVLGGLATSDVTSRARRRAGSAGLQARQQRHVAGEQILAPAPGIGGVDDNQF